MSKKNERTYWYDYSDINNLLIEKSQGRYYKVIEATATDDLQILQRVNEAFAVLNIPDSLDTVVIPINVGSSNQGIWQGTHWVGLVIKKNNTTFKAFYTDSLGTFMENNFPTSEESQFCTLKQILINHGLAENSIIECNINLPQVQQNNGYDCGPWTIFNLDALARTEMLPQNIDDNEIIVQRSSLLCDTLIDLEPVISSLFFAQKQLEEDDQVCHTFKKQLTIIKETDVVLDDLPIHSVQNASVLTIEEIRKQVELVLSSKDIINIDKISQLKEIEINHYKPLIQQLAYKKTAEEMKSLVIVLKDLGYLTTKLGELSSELKYYTDAAIFYQYVIAILDEKLDEKLISAEDKNEFIKQELLDPHQQLTHIQQLIFSAIGTNQGNMPIVQEEAKTNKDLLLALRNATDQEMQEIEGYYQKVKTDSQEEKQEYRNLYVNAARELFKCTANEMKKFLAKLYRDSEQQVAIPPCKYAVMGLGSMALQQMTPYSDLEFAILTENEDYKQSVDPKVREYFKNLSYLVNFKIITLGESTHPISKYGLDISHLAHVGVNFDLGGKTSLGRIDGDKPYELIKTIDWMLHYVRNKGDKASHIDKNLPYILQNVCYVHGDEELVKTYKAKIAEFLHSTNEDAPQGRLNCEIRAIKLLEEGTVEIDYLYRTENLEPKKIEFKGDLQKLQPELFTAESRLFDVKQEIYRLPDRLVYNLGLYYGIEGDSGWDTVDKLRDQGIITSQAALNLKNAITFATTLRLKTYSYYKAQKEAMSIFTRSVNTESKLEEQIKQIFCLSKEDLGEQGGLFQYFYTALPLHERLKDFCDRHQELDKANKQTYFKESKFYTDDAANKGFIYYRLAQYKAAQKCLELALVNPQNQDNLQIRIALGSIYNNFGNGDKAIEQYEHGLDISKRIYQNPTAVADALNNLAAAYYFKEQYDQAIEHLEKSLEIKKLLYKDKPHADVAASLNNLGLAFRAKGQYDQAIEHLEKSLEIKKLLYKDKPHTDVAGSLNNLGDAHGAKGQYDQAIEHLEKSLEISKLIYKDEPHTNVAASLNSLGIVYDKKEQYDQAINYHQKSLKMRKLIYKEGPHPDVAGSLNNLGLAYGAKEHYDDAIKYHKESLEMRKVIYGENRPHPDIVSSLNNLWEVYRAKGQYDQAIKYYEEILEMRIKDFHQLYDMIIQDQDTETLTGYAEKHCPEELTLLSNDPYTATDNIGSNNADIIISSLGDSDLTLLFRTDC